MFFLSHLIYSFSVIYGNTQSLFYELFYELILNPKLESDVFEITLNCPETQEPNARFMRYLNSQNVNDVTTTFSMEGLLRGFYSSMERFKEASPVHLLISTK